MARADEGENLLRLREMDREQRTKLLDRLTEFDALDRDQREQIQKLDASIAASDPAVRTRLLAVLHRYHVFYQGLPKEKREQLDAEKDLTLKLRLISTLMSEKKLNEEMKRRFADGIQISQLTTTRLRPTARQLIVWFSLDPKNKEDVKLRAEFAKLKKPEERRVFAENLIRDRKLMREVRAEDEEFKEDRKAVLNEFNRLEDERLKQLVKKGGALAKTKDLPPQAKEAAERKIRDDVLERLVEIKVLRDHENQQVDPSNLERFEAAMPPWARESLDALPPDAARRRLVVLYRLVFPEGEEISRVFEAPPEPTRPAPAAKPTPANGAGAPF